MHHLKDFTKKQEAVIMDDLWVSRVHSSKHLPTHLSSGNQVMLDNSGVMDDGKTSFTCPFCYVDTELSMLCDHLQEEHCFDVKNAVCPVCALSLGKDVVGHFKVHHANSIKTQKRPQKSGFWSFYAGRTSLGGLRSGIENVASAPDPLLSPFLFSYPHSGSKGDQSRDLCSGDDVSSILEMESSKPSLMDQSELKGDSEELRQKAAFCQQLFFSTIL